MQLYVTTTICHNPECCNSELSIDVYAMEDSQVWCGGCGNEITDVVRGEPFTPEPWPTLEA